MSAAAPQLLDVRPAPEPVGFEGTVVCMDCKRIVGHRWGFDVPGMVSHGLCSKCYGARKEELVKLKGI